MNNGARLCASARLCRGSPVIVSTGAIFIVYIGITKSYTAVTVLACQLCGPIRPYRLDEKDPIGRLTL